MYKRRENEEEDRDRPSNKGKRMNDQQNFGGKKEEG